MEKHKIKSVGSRVRSSEIWAAWSPDYMGFSTRFRGAMLPSNRPVGIVHFCMTWAHISSSVPVAFCYLIYDSGVLCLSAPCTKSNVMTAESNFPLEASSNQEKADGLKDPTKQAWTSSPSDPNPTITATVAESDSLVTDINLPDTTNVEEVTTTVLRQDGTVVSSQYGGIFVTGVMIHNRHVIFWGAVHSVQ